MTIELMKKIDELHPWYYEVKVGNYYVEPGINSKQSCLELVRRENYRKNILLDEVKKRYKFPNKSVLDLACNCAYWSSLYAMCGAKSVVGLEGRDKYTQQAQLYWDNHKELKHIKHEFKTVDLNDLSAWKYPSKSFDFVLCAGILYHVPNWRGILTQACSVAKEAVLVDTRVGDGAWQVEPGGWHFDGVGKDVKKCNPRLEDILVTMQGLGFKTEVLPHAGKVPDEMAHNDDYRAKKRVAILGLKK